MKYFFFSLIFLLTLRWTPPSPTRLIAKVQILMSATERLWLAVPDPSLMIRCFWAPRSLRHWLRLTSDEPRSQSVTSTLCRALSNVPISTTYHTVAKIISLSLSPGGLIHYGLYVSISFHSSKILRQLLKAGFHPPGLETITSIFISRQYHVEDLFCYLLHVSPSFLCSNDALSMPSHDSIDFPRSQSFKACSSALSRIYHLEHCNAPTTFRRVLELCRLLLSSFLDRMVLRNPAILTWRFFTVRIGSFTIYIANITVSSPTIDGDLNDREYLIVSFQWG